MTQTLMNKQVIPEAVPSLLEKLEALPTELHGEGAFIEQYVKLEDLRAIIEQAKAEKQEPVAIQAGYKLVPIEPTQEMIDAGDAAWLSLYAESKDTWEAMLSAAPEPSQPDILAELVNALEHSRACLEAANNSGLINDTLWAGNAETLFDYMDAAVTRAKEYLK